MIGFVIGLVVGAAIGVGVMTWHNWEINRTISRVTADKNKEIRMLKEANAQLRNTNTLRDCSDAYRRGRESAYTKKTDSPVVRFGKSWESGRQKLTMVNRDTGERFEKEATE